MSKFAGLAAPRKEFARMYLLHPTTREPLVSPQGAGYIDIYSPKSEKAAAERARIVARNTARNATKKAGARILVGEAEADAINMLAVCTAAWLLVDVNGNVIDEPCTEDNARELYGTADLRWIRDDLNVFREDDTNFIGVPDAPEADAPADAPAAGE